MATAEITGGRTRESVPQRVDSVQHNILINYVHGQGVMTFHKAGHQYAALAVQYWDCSPVGQCLVNKMCFCSLLIECLNLLSTYCVYY
jgi:hypothetical protein